MVDSKEVYDKLVEFQEELDSVLEDLNDAKTFRDHVFDMVDPLTTVRSSLRIVLVETLSIDDRMYERVKDGIDKVSATFAGARKFVKAYGDISKIKYALKSKEASKVAAPVVKTITAESKQLVGVLTKIADQNGLNEFSFGGGSPAIPPAPAGTSNADGADDDLGLPPMEATSHPDAMNCVQCGRSYLPDTNSDTNCRFHKNPAKVVSGDYVWDCCGKRVACGSMTEMEAARLGKACQTSPHRPVHHTEYEYAGYKIWAKEKMQTVGKEWANVSVEEFRSDAPSLWASIGIHGEGLYVALGHGKDVSADGVSRFYPVDRAMLSGISSSDSKSNSLFEGCYKYELTGKAGGEDWSVEAAWTIDTYANIVTGLEISVKTVSSKAPVKKIVHFTYPPFELEEVEKVGKSGKSMRRRPTKSKRRNYRIKRERTADYFPTALFEEPGGKSRRPAPEPVIDLIPSGMEQVKFQVVSEEGIAINPDGGAGKDLFTFEATCTNGSDTDITFVGGTTQARAGGPGRGAKWLDGKFSLSGTKFPLTIPKGATSDPFTVTLTFDTPEKPDAWFFRGRSWLGRSGTFVELRTQWEDTRKAEIGYRVAVHNPAADFPSKAETDLWFAFADDLAAWERHFVRAARNRKTKKDLELSIAGRYFAVDETVLKKLAFEAAEAAKADPPKDGLGEVPIKKLQNASIKTAALVDLDLGEVYAFRSTLTVSTGGRVVDYFLWPADYMGTSLSLDIASVNTSKKIVPALPPKASRRTKEELESAAVAKGKVPSFRAPPKGGLTSVVADSDSSSGPSERSTRSKKKGSKRRSSRRSRSRSPSVTLAEHLNQGNKVDLDVALKTGMDGTLAVPGKKGKRRKSRSRSRSRHGRSKSPSGH